MNGNLRVGNLFGIPFYVNVSWFLVLLLVTWQYGSGLAAAFPLLGGSLPWVLGLAAALLLFASVLAHELGHSFAAMKQSIGVNSITLFLFGGLAALEKESETPKGAFWVAIAGPLVSFALFGLFSALGFALPVGGPIAGIVALLAYINLALGAFNLIPGLPLDGGNVLKAIVWKITGQPYKGMVFASRVGQLIGWTAIALGAASIVGLSPVGSIWTLLIGLFLLQNANRSAQFGEVQGRLAGLTAEDAIAADSPVVSASASLREFADDALLAAPSAWRKFLVADATGMMVGTVLVDALKQVPREQWANTTVAAIMESASDMITVGAEEPLMEVVKTLETRKIQALAVIRNDGSLAGLLEKASIQALLQSPQAA
ncbi:site-2 protease family protein [Nodosilinea sp. LEGE 07088]|uniref:site-2 protease family protein n=1 Tax=Nodosilinea sp. LEGE 07088 TaxID=2777968 RepID=UPI00188192F6|nr:site-2 protease family protein [Nodosilinea sp. LEGE 07088]MBE9138565.1 site-2 protease family protein [Nodosilinea sp. LEGE 07088]